MKILSIFAVCIFTFSVSAQQDKCCSCAKNDKVKIAVYFENLEKQNKLIAECFANQDVSLILKKPISHFFSTVISLPKPYYPAIARTQRIFGTVDVEVIFDEAGYVFYSKTISGNKIFWASAKKAACFSRFAPVLYCGKPVKQKRIIRYNFIL